MKKFYTDCFVVRDGRILLGRRKKLGFGEGKWDGFGGKLEGTESYEDGAKRELKEECGLNWISGQEVGSIIAVMEKDGNELESRIYLVDQVAGEPVESDEMIPEWFPLDQIPYDGMWEDTRHWLPLVLAGKKIHATFTYDQDDKIISMNVRELIPVTIESGEYQHYRGNRYRVLGLGTHSETLEPYVIYQALFGEEKTYLRPYSMFIETVEIEGKLIPRFQRLG